MSADHGYEPRDLHAPRFRVRPPANWVNDPNGPFRWRGRYHLFYQYNPDAPVHANMHWGHASSLDLAHWEHHPIALTPTPGGPDEGGCWSGCVVDDAGVPTAVYTGVDREHAGLGAICLAQAASDSAELTAWRSLPDPVVSGPPEGLDVTMFRDPFVFRHGGRRWALVGAGHGDGTPSVLLYDCDDLTSWRFAGVLVDGRNAMAVEAFGNGAVGWECPQLYEGDAGGEWVLVVSLWDGDPVSTAYLTGRLITATDGGLPRFIPHAGGRLDEGRDFYAPAVLHDTEAGRTLLWGWSWEARDRRDVADAGWSGVLTAPRVVGTHPDGRVRVAPAPELQLLRSETPFATEPVRTPLPLAYDLEITAVATTTVTLLRTASGKELTLTLDPAAGTVTLDRTGWPRERPDGSGPITLRSTPAALGGLALRVLVDGSLLELFAADRAVATERVYRRPDDIAELTLHGEGVTVTGWEVVAPEHG
ncbi:glycoside hydrolase family 32 protein [Streptomyces sp. NPDC047525]|uniref:glycoside hydrolase family 32 protein n=1 Tax=Streptomyces sp. NPDC047525 TaxID=3155264 RepID=UPI0033EF6197